MKPLRRPFQEDRKPTKKALKGVVATKSLSSLSCDGMPKLLYAWQSCLTATGPSYRPWWICFCFFHHAPIGIQVIDSLDRLTKPSVPQNSGAPSWRGSGRTYSSLMKVHIGQGCFKGSLKVFSNYC